MSSDKDHMRKYMLDRYYRRKNAAIEELGGKCVKCGSEDKLEFDHIDPATKLYTMAKIFSGGSNVKVAEELAKCQLLCTNCHAVKSNTIDNAVEHGGGTQGKKGCKCPSCKSKKNEYMRQWKLNRHG